MLSVTDADRRYQDIDKDAAAKDGMWASFKGPTPYFDKYHEEGEEQDIELLTTTDDWWWYGTSTITIWYQAWKEFFSKY